MYPEWWRLSASSDGFCTEWTCLLYVGEFRPHPTNPCRWISKYDNRVPGFGSLPNAWPNENVPSGVRKTLSLELRRRARRGPWCATEHGPPLVAHLFVGGEARRRRMRGWRADRRSTELEVRRPVADPTRERRGSTRRQASTRRRRRFSTTPFFCTAQGESSSSIRPWAVLVRIVPVFERGRLRARVSTRGASAGNRPCAVPSRALARVHQHALGQQLGGEYTVSRRAVQPLLAGRPV